MKVTKLKERLNQDRPMLTISIRMPEDVIEDLKKVAPVLGFSGYQPLIRAYVGQGLRVDLEKLENQNLLSNLVESLKKRGVDDQIISSAVAEVQIA